MRRVVASALVVLLGTSASGAWAQQVSPALLEAARQAYQQGQLRQAEILAPAQVPAASETDWNNLAQLRVWDHIVCKTKDGEWHRGNFVAFSEEALSLRVGKRDVGLRRGDVVRVSLLGPPNRVKAALIGLGIGFAGGAIITAAAFRGAEDGAAAYSLLVGWLFGGIGAGVGAAAAPRSQTVIYRAKP